ncbi:glypican-6-like [Watersipora subatra]|uniref:glypican-6-like n=1 Tax=Watersipora subatra TaxID=2589382 RepID=UPI00355C9916
MRTRGCLCLRNMSPYWIYMAATLLFTFGSKQAVARATSQCEEVKEAYTGMGFSPLDVPKSSIALKGDDLQICPAGFSCCSRNMESQLTSHSRQRYEERLVGATDAAKRRLVTVTTEIHAFFTELIEKSEKEMDEMFTKVYQDQYVNNKDVFVQFFADLRSYYNGEDLDVSQAINQFFRDVFVRMFNIQHMEYNFTEPYLACVGDKMDTIKPFGEYPAQLQRNLKQALVSARTYMQGLAVARNVVISTQKVQPTASCVKATMKMNFCSHCRGLPSIKPCANYCLNVMKGCLAYHGELHMPWGQYIDAMEMLSMRLKSDGSFNIESVLTPLKDQVSIVIMQYYDSSQRILHQVLDSENGCGQPPSKPTRSKRSVPFVSEDVPFRTRTGSQLKIYVESVKRILREEKMLWAYNALPGTMCSSISATTGSQCWNGEDDAVYTKPLIGNGLIANQENPEVEVDPSRMDPMLQEQIQQLQNITAAIYNVTIGAGDVAWVKLQIPLPNVSSTSLGESRAVKSYYDRVRFQDWGSGKYDDEVEMSSGSGSLFPFIPYDTFGSGSGLAAQPNKNIDEEEEVDVIITDTVPYNPVQPKPGNIPPEVPHGRDERPEIKATTQKLTAPSSSNSLCSTPTLAVSLALLLISVKYWSLL